MPLSCSCDYDYEFEEGDWYYDLCDPDFEPLPGKRGKRCCSCGKLIKVGELCLSHDRVRYPYNNIESRIKLNMGIDDALCEPAEIKIPPHYQCEKCGEIWLNLNNVGFECLSPGEDMSKSLKEFISTYNPQKLIIE